jgi:hypothetical protein
MTTARLRLTGTGGTSRFSTRRTHGSEIGP